MHLELTLGGGGGGKEVMNRMSLAQKFKSCCVRKVQQLLGEIEHAERCFFFFPFLNAKTSAIIESQKQQISTCKQPTK